MITISVYFRNFRGWGFTGFQDFFRFFRFSGLFRFLVYLIPPQKEGFPSHVQSPQQQPLHFLLVSVGFSFYLLGANLINKYLGYFAWEARGDLVNFPGEAGRGGFLNLAGCPTLDPTPPHTASPRVTLLVPGPDTVDSR